MTTLTAASPLALCHLFSPRVDAGQMDNPTILDNGLSIVSTRDADVAGPFPQILGHSCVYVFFYCLLHSHINSSTYKLHFRKKKKKTWASDFRSFLPRLPPYTFPWWLVDLVYFVYFMSLGLSATLQSMRAPCGSPCAFPCNKDVLVPLL